MMKKRLLIALCCLVLLVQLLPVVPFAETVDVGIPEQKSDIYYCREQLKTLDNSEALLFAYDSIVEGIDACKSEIIISKGRYQVSPAEFEMVLEATRRDHTEQFWMGGKYTPYSNYSGTVIEKIVPTYLMTGEELQDARAAFEQAINQMLNRLTPDMSEYEMEKALHDMLAVHVDYVSGANAHNAYGALVEGKAVCEGYAEALQCLLQRVGIQSVEIFGYGINPSTGLGEPHAWNAVRIDNEYYLVDLTWNDQDTLLAYAYFNQTSAIMDQDHEQWMIGENSKGEILVCDVFDLPVCTATAANYFAKENRRITTYTAESIGTLLKDNKLSVSVFVDSDVEEFRSWYKNNSGAIARVAGVSYPFVHGSMVIGREVRIYMNGCMHSNARRVAAKAATCTEDGNIEYYVCRSEKCGKWFSDDHALHEIFNHDSVKVFATGHTWERKMDETTRKEGETYWYTCSVCGEVSSTYSFSLEPEEHTCAQVNIFLKIWNAILNFFRSLFGLPELCTCGEVINSTSIIIKQQGLWTLLFCVL